MARETFQINSGSGSGQPVFEIPVPEPADDAELSVSAEDRYGRKVHPIEGVVLDHGVVRHIPVRVQIWSA